MSAPPLKGNVLACSNKRRWCDEFAARAGAMDAINRYRVADRLWIYNCSYCRGWHLTKSNCGIDYMVTGSLLVCGKTKSQSDSPAT